jgi:enoyl-CoA hydratase
MPSRGVDGLMRNTPEAREFIAVAESEGVASVVARRDAPFCDYSQAQADGKPDPENVIVVGSPPA